MILASRIRSLSRPSFARGILANWLYPLAPQIAAGIVFLLILLFAFLGPPLGENNLSVVATWKLWWLLLPFSFLFLGRLWCSICPIGAVNDLALKIPFSGRKAPGAVLRGSGAWVMGILFLLLFWIGVARHICCFPKATAAVLLLFVAGAVAAGLAFHGRAWCRYLCPVGIYAALLSMASLVGLRSQREVCRDRCRTNKRQVLRGELRSCPLYELSMAMDTNRNCNLCGQCVKYCPHGSLGLTWLRPGRELWRLKRPLSGEAIFVVTLIVIAFVEALQTTRLFPRYMKWAIELNISSNYDAVFSLSLLAMVALALGAYVLASYLSTWLGKDRGQRALASFGYGFLPLALAAVLGVAIFRLANEGARAAKVAINQLSFSLNPFDLPPPVRGSLYSANPSLKALQIAILALGTLGALYVIARIARRRGGAGALARALPQIALVLLLSASFLLTFLQPAGVILH